MRNRLTGLKVLRDVLKKQPNERIVANEMTVDPEKAAKMTIEPVHPELVHRERLRVLRRQFQEDSQELKKKKEAEFAAKKQRELDNIASFQAKVEEYKKERLLKETDFAYDPAIAAAPKDRKEVDPLILKRQEMYRKAAQQAKVIRKENRLANLKEKSDSRLAHFLHLFYEAKDFVTPSNLELKLEQAFPQNATPAANADKAKLSMITIDPELAQKARQSSLETERTNALRSIMNPNVSAFEQTNLDLMREAVTEEKQEESKASKNSKKTAAPVDESIVALQLEQQRKLEEINKSLSK